MLETLLLATALSIHPDMGDTHEYPRQNAVRVEEVKEEAVHIKKNRKERRKEKALKRKR